MLRLDIGLSYEAKWHNLTTAEIVDEPNSDDPFLLIEPQPFSDSNLMIRDGAILITGKEQCRLFKKALKDMKNVVDMNGNPVPCTDHAKQKIFDWKMGGIADFVVGTLWEFRQAKEAEEKNS